MLTQKGSQFFRALTSHLSYWLLSLLALLVQKVQILTPEALQLFVARSGRICHLVASLQGSGVQAQDSLNVHSLSLYDVVHRAAKALGLAGTKFTCFTSTKVQLLTPLLVQQCEY